MSNVEGRCQTRSFLLRTILVDRDSVCPIPAARDVMARTKADLTKSLMNRIRFKNPRKGRQQLLFPELDYTGLTRTRAARLVDTLFEIMKKELEKGGTVLVSGFGKLQTRFKWARKGRDPQTGKSIILKSRRVVFFQYASRLKDRINNHDKEAS